MNHQAGRSSISLGSISDGVSPQYDDLFLLKAFEQFIAAFGQRYDGSQKHRVDSIHSAGSVGQVAVFR
jgi:hypothetical protein